MLEINKKYWIVTYGSGNFCLPVLLSDAKVKQNSPELKFEHDGKTFTVEFESQSDYMAARDSSIERPVIIVSANRSKRVKGLIVNKRV
jgi:hypothetical protein